MAAIISAENLTKKYGELIAVDHVSFEIPSGAITGFVWPQWRW